MAVLVQPACSLAIDRSVSVQFVDPGRVALESGSGGETSALLPANDGPADALVGISTLSTGPSNKRPVRSACGSTRGPVDAPPSRCHEPGAQRRRLLAANSGRRSHDERRRISSFPSKARRSFVPCQEFVHVSIGCVPDRRRRTKRSRDRSPRPDERGGVRDGGHAATAAPLMDSPAKPDERVLYDGLRVRTVSVGSCRAAIDMLRARRKSRLKLRTTLRGPTVACSETQWRRGPQPERTWNGTC